MAKVRLDLSGIKHIFGQGGVVDYINRNLFGMAPFNTTVCNLPADWLQVQPDANTQLPYFPDGVSLTIPRLPADAQTVARALNINTGGGGLNTNKPMWRGMAKVQDFQYTEAQSTWYNILQGRNGWKSIFDMTTPADQIKYINDFIKKRDQYIDYVPPTDMQALATFGEAVVAVALTIPTGGISDLTFFAGQTIGGISKQSDYTGPPIVTVNPATVPKKINKPAIDDLRNEGIAAVPNGIFVTASQVAKPAATAPAYSYWGIAAILVFTLTGFLIFSK